MKNKRQIAKEATRALIIDKSKRLIIEKGILATTTKEISDYCQLAHGTIFSHFGNREKLIAAIIKIELTEIAKQLYGIKEQSNSIKSLLAEYLLLVEQNEAFLTVINKEFSFLSKSLQREIITTESIVKNLFYNRIDKSHKNGELNVQTAVSFLFGTINYYLSRKEYFTSSGSVIGEKKNDIINTFILMIKQ